MKTTKDRLHEVMDRYNLRAIDIAERSGLTRGAISQYLSGKVTPKQDKIYLLAKALNVSPSYLMGIDDVPAAPPPTTTPVTAAAPTGWLAVPVMGSVACGAPIDAPGDLSDTVYIPPDIARGSTIDDFLVIRAAGESMEPEILDGDILVFRRSPDLHSSRTIYAISFGDPYHYTAKLVRRDEDGNLAITALNPDAWDPMLLTPAKANDKNFRLHGYLVYLSRRKYVV